MDDFYGGLHSDDCGATSAAFASALDPATRAPYDVEYRTIGEEDGAIRLVAARGRKLFDEAGRADGTSTDVTTLGVRRAGYGTVDTIAGTITIERDWTANGIESIAGELHCLEYGSYIEKFKRGETATMSDAHGPPLARDRQRAERDLRENEALLRAVFDAVPVGIVFA